MLKNHHRGSTEFPLSNLSLFFLQIAISNPSPEVLLTFSKSGLVELIGKEWYFVRVHDAVQVCLQHVQSLKAGPDSSLTPLSSFEDKPSLFARLSKDRAEKFSVTDLESGNGRPPHPKDRDSQLEPLLPKERWSLLCIVWYKVYLSILWKKISRLNPGVIKLMLKK